MPHRTLPTACRPDSYTNNRMAGIILRIGSANNDSANLGSTGRLRATHQNPRAWEGAPPPSDSLILHGGGREEASRVPQRYFARSHDDASIHAAGSDPCPRSDPRRVALGVR